MECAKFLLKKYEIRDLGIKNSNEGIWNPVTGTGNSPQREIKNPRLSMSFSIYIQWNPVKATTVGP